jgi:hypothetical protein
MKTIVVIIFCLIFISTLFAQTRSPWEMNLGEGIVSFGYMTPSHGAIEEYDFATIPAPEDADWMPALDSDIIGYCQVPSTLCNIMECRYGADFTYFRTFVDIPSNVSITEFTIVTPDPLNFDECLGVDDGMRVSVFNSAYPGGIVVTGSYIFLGGTGTENLKDLVISGESNTVIVTHVDDCCEHSILSRVEVSLNGELVPVPFEIDIDIKPGSCPNSINCHNERGVITVAALTTDFFDATTIDHTTAVFQTATETHTDKKTGEARRHEEDVDNDGDIDLVFHFRFMDTDLDCYSQTGTLVAQTYDGETVKGTDSVRMVPKDK